MSWLYEKDSADVPSVQIQPRPFLINLLIHPAALCCFRQPVCVSNETCPALNTQSSPKSCLPAVLSISVNGDSIFLVAQAKPGTHYLSRFHYTAGPPPSLLALVWLLPLLLSRSKPPSSLVRFARMATSFASLLLPFTVEFHSTVRGIASKPRVIRSLDFRMTAVLFRL